MPEGVGANIVIRSCHSGGVFEGVRKFEDGWARHSSITCWKTSRTNSNVSCENIDLLTCQRQADSMIGNKGQQIHTTGDKAVVSECSHLSTGSIHRRSVPATRLASASCHKEL